MRPLLVAALLVLTPLTASAGTEWAAQVHAAADSLIARIEPDGQFRYRLDAHGRPLPGYNVLRHAGALWALQQVHAGAPEPERAEALNRASQWLEACCLAPLEQWPFEALWSVPEGRPREAKLGGAGLALAAWNGMAEQGLAHPPASRLRRLAQFIVYLQRPDGSFHSKFREGQRRGRWVSLYYPGEAALGLLAQYRRDPNPLWRDAAIEALTYLARTRAASGDYPIDHWALIASAALARLDGSLDPLLDTHARRIVERILAAQTAEGHFSERQRAAPTATRLEALAAVRQFTADGTTAASRLDTALRHGAAFLVALQINQGPYAGAVQRAHEKAPDPRRGELRIDDTQHVLSVWWGLCSAQKYSCTRP